MRPEFRAGNESAGAGAVEFLKGCEAQLPAGKTVSVRSDSAWDQAAVVNHCLAQGRRFTITADQDRAVQAALAQIPESDGQPYYTREGIATDREIAETVPGLKESKESFRLIGVRWKNPQPSLLEADPYGYHAVASNRDETESASEVLWGHNQRGEAENGRQELKRELGMEQMPCGQQEAHAVFFAMGVLAYNLSLALQAKRLPAQYRHASVATLRWKLYRLAGQLIRHAGGGVLKMKAEGEKLASRPAGMRRKCDEWSVT